MARPQAGSELSEQTPQGVVFIFVCPMLAGHVPVYASLHYCWRVRLHCFQGQVPPPPPFHTCACECMSAACVALVPCMCGPSQHQKAGRDKCFTESLRSKTTHLSLQHTIAHMARGLCLHAWESSHLPSSAPTVSAAPLCTCNDYAAQTISKPPFPSPTLPRPSTCSLSCTITVTQMITAHKTACDMDCKLRMSLPLRHSTFAVSVF